jgi:sugar phosphate isomerase/epimerase
MTDKSNRRNFLKLMTVGAVLPAASFPKNAIAKTPTRKSKKKPKFELGMASYSLREFKLDDTLAMTKRLGLKKIAFKSFHLPLDSSTEAIKETVAKVKKSGLHLYGGGVIYMKNADEVNRAFEYAKTAGMKVIIGVPNHDLLGLVEKKVKEYDIKLAIHNHGPGDKVYPTPQSAYEKIKSMDKRMGLCIDVGHTQRSGIDPSVAARECADRLHDIHLKDVSESTGKGKTVEIGRGVIDIPKFLKTLIDIDYSAMASFEYEKDSKDPLPGLAESIGYTRGVLAVV